MAETNRLPEQDSSRRPINQQSIALPELSGIARVRDARLFIASQPPEYIAISNRSREFLERVDKTLKEKLTPNPAPICGGVKSRV